VAGSGDTQCELQEKCQKCGAFNGNCLQQRHINDIAKRAVFIRHVDADFELAVLLLELVPLKQKADTH
jgi:hypothetical protein